MAAVNHNIVLWAVPRFRRPMRHNPDNGNRLNTTPGDTHGLEELVLKSVAEGIAENPDGAACLYARDMWRRTSHFLSEAARR
jgi:hypothetical protein